MKFRIRRVVSSFAIGAVFGVSLVSAACSSSSGDDDDNAGPDSGSNADTSVTSDTGSDVSAFDASTTDASATNDASDAAIVDASDGGSSTPPQVCTPAATLVDVSTPTTVVGTGTAASCTASALASAVTTGGIITFSCGAAPVTITLTTPLVVTANTTIDGKNLVTLSGGGASRILTMAPGFTQTTPLLTVQRLAFVDGVAGKPDAGAAGVTDSGGAIYASGGSVTVIDSTFSNNQSVSPGEDVGGGAIFIEGNGALIVDGSIFDGNKGSNGGAIKTISAHVTMTNSRFTTNAATGSGGSPGNGGTGGALGFDGPQTALSICGSVFSNNSAGALGGGIFRVGYDVTSTTTIDRSTFDGNSAVQLAGAVYLQDHTIVLTNSTLSHNTSAAAGAADILVQNNGASLTFENDTIAFNTASNPIEGGGIFLSVTTAPAVGGVRSLSHCTIANNNGDGVFGASSFVTLSSSIIANNSDSLFHQDSCFSGQFASGAGKSIQFPVDDDAGIAETACASGVVFADPQLGALQDNGGPTLTLLPASGSPAESDAGCSGTDQRGVARTKCTAGAVEGL